MGRCADTNPIPVPALTVPAPPANISGVLPDPGAAQTLIDQLIGHLAAIAGIVYETRPILAVVMFGLGFLAGVLYYMGDFRHHIHYD